MPGINVTRSDLSAILGQDVTEERFASVLTTATGLIRSVYKGDLSIVEGRHAEVVSAVFTSIAVRLLTNPTGARTVGLGTANITFGGSDRNMAESTVLTDAEASMLRTLQATRPTYVRIGLVV